MEEVVGKVREVVSNGLYIVLEGGSTAFLPKENMHVGKKKKLSDIFSKGYVIKAKVKSKKEDSIVLKYFLTHSLEDSCLLKMNKIQRNKLLEQIIKYYLWHIPTFKSPKSWEVLRTIL